MRSFLLAVFFLLPSLGAFATALSPVLQRQFPSVIELLTGEFMAPRPEEAKPYYEGVQKYPYLEPSLRAMAAGNLSAARDSMSLLDSTARAYCGVSVPFLNLAILYLEKYAGSDLQNPTYAPLFEGFNGGFATFVQQGLRWDTLKVLPKPVLDSVLVTWMEVLHRGQYTAPGIYYEMMGDLLLRFDDVDMSRWLSAMAYLRAAEEYSDLAIADRYHTKAIYAMESHRQNPTTFNRYRFNQLKDAFHPLWAQGKAQRADKSLPWADQARLGGTLTPIAEFDLAPASVEHPLVKIIDKDREISGEIVEGDPNRETMNRDIDLKQIKQVPIHNAFAISMILIVIGSAFYFYVRLRRRAHELDAEERAADEAKR